MNINRRTVISAFIFLAIIALTLFYGREFVREFIVVPLSYWVFVLTTLVGKLPQWYFWVLVLVISAVIAYRSFTSERRVIEREPMVEDIGPGQSRVEYWANRVSLIHYGQFYESNFNEALGRLVIDLLAYRNRLTVRQIDRGLTTGTLNVPPEVRDFLLKNVLQRSFENVPFLIYLYRAARLAYKSMVRHPKVRRADLDPGQRRLIEYIEEELEVHYDNPGQ